MAVSFFCFVLFYLVLLLGREDVVGPWATDIDGMNRCGVCGLPRTGVVRARSRADPGSRAVKATDPWNRATEHPWHTGLVRPGRPHSRCPPRAIIRRQRTGPLFLGNIIFQVANHPCPSPAAATTITIDERPATTPAASTHITSPANPAPRTSSPLRNGPTSSPVSSRRLFFSLL